MNTPNDSDFVYSLTVEQRIEYHKLKTQIQLDAMREGMLKATTVIEQTESAWNSDAIRILTAILTAANQLTEKDLV